MKIANKIILSIFFVTLTLTVIAGSFFYRVSSRSLRRAIEGDLTATVFARAQHVETYLDLIQIAVVQLSNNQSVKDFLEAGSSLPPSLTESFRNFFEAVTDIMRNAKDVNSGIIEYLLMDRMGKVVASSATGGVGIDLSADSIFLGGKKEIYFKDVYDPGKDGEPLMAVSIPILDGKTGHLLGVLAAKLKLDRLNRILEDRTGAGQTGDFYLCNRYGFMATPSRFKKDSVLKQKIGRTSPDVFSPGKSSGEAPPAERSAHVYRDYRGVEVLGFSEPIPRMRWNLVGEFDTEEIFRPLSQLKLFFLLALAAAPVVSWLTGKYLSGRITDPLLRVSRGAKMIGEGNLDYRIGSDAADEIGQLARSFDATAERLKKTTTSIEALSEEIEVRRRTEAMLENERVFSGAILENMNAGVVACDEKGELTLFNRLARDWHGTDPSKIPQGEWAKHYDLYLEDGVTPMDIHTVPLSRAFRGERVENAGLVIAVKGKARRSIVSQASPIKGADGRILGAVAVMHDVTKLREVEAALREREEYFRSLIDNAMDVVTILDATGTVRYASPSIRRVLGYAPEEFLARNIFEFIHPEDRERISRIFFENIPKTGLVLTVMIRLLHRDGSWRTMESVCHNRTDHPSITGVVVNSRDMTEREEAEEALRISEDKFRTIFEQAPIGVALIDSLDGKIYELNQRYAEIAGRSVEEMKTLDWMSITHPEDVQADLDNMALLNTGKISRFAMTKRYLRPDGTSVWISLTVVRIKITDPKCPRHLAMIDDISESKKAERALRDREMTLRAIADSAQDAILMMDNGGKISFWNPAAERLFGWSGEEAVGKNLHELIAPERFLDAYRRAFPHFRATGRGAAVGRTIELWGTRKDRTEFPFELSLSSIQLSGEWHAVGIVRDISERTRMFKEREKLQVQFLQAQKMESVGTMASGIAHNFNNILASIRGRIEMVHDDLTPENKSRRDLELAIESIEAAKKLIEQMLIFGRVYDQQISRIEICPVIKNSLDMFRASVKGVVEIREHFEEGCGFILANSNQLQHIILNLLTNSFQAIRDGGVIDVALSWLRTGEGCREKYAYALTGPEYVKLSVRDTGCGIEPKVIDLIFGPFFTTKEVGKGTGLGLSTVHGIVAEMGGEIFVESEVGKGTVFHVFFPRSPA
jgi:PAS domain S-box-containing protein